MKKVLLISRFYLLGLFVLGLSPWQSGYAADFSVINPVLRNILDEVIQGDRWISVAYPNFDERFSDLKTERLKYDLTAVIKNTPWRAHGLANVQASVIYQVDREPDHMGILLQARSEISTDVLALLRYAGLRGVQEIDRDPSERNVPWKNLLTELSQVESLQSVASLLQRSNALALKTHEEDLLKLSEELRKLQTSQFYFGPSPKEVEIAWLNQRIKSCKQFMLACYSMQFSVNPKEIQIRTHHPDGYVSTPDGSKIKHSEVTLIIDARSFRLKTEAFFSKTRASLDKIKADFKVLARGLQENQAHQVEEAQTVYRDALRAFRNAMRERL